MTVKGLKDLLKNFHEDSPIKVVLRDEREGRIELELGLAWMSGSNRPLNLEVVRKVDR